MKSGRGRGEADGKGIVRRLVEEQTSHVSEQDDTWKAIYTMLQQASFVLILPHLSRPPIARYFTI